MNEPTRIKFTVGPPDLCEGCYWRFQYLCAEEQVKALRRELVAKRALTRPSREKPEEAEAVTANTRDADVVDLVEQFRRHGAE
jgi:hypothetical protein